jgi:hypothetical protein
MDGINGTHCDENMEFTTKPNGNADTDKVKVKTRFVLTNKINRF